MSYFVTLEQDISELISLNAEHITCLYPIPARTNLGKGHLAYGGDTCAIELNSGGRDYSQAVNEKIVYVKGTLAEVEEKLNGGNKS